MEKRFFILMLTLFLIFAFLGTITYEYKSKISGNVIQETENLTINYVEALTARPFTISPGQIARIATQDVQVKFLGITEDSRCPLGVTCIWQGAAVAELEFTKGKNSATIKLADDSIGNYSSQTDLFYYRVKVTNIQPVPRANETISPGDYNVTLVVSPTR